MICNDCCGKCKIYLNQAQIFKALLDGKIILSSKSYGNRYKIINGMVCRYDFLNEKGNEVWSESKQSFVGSNCEKFYVEAEGVCHVIRDEKQNIVTQCRPRRD